MANILKANKTIVKHVLLLTGFWFFVFLPVRLSATHIVGGNLTYKHISGTTYQVKLVLRRDCLLGSPEAEFDNPASIAVFTAGGELAKWLPGLTEGQIFIPFMSSDTLNQYIRSDCGFEGTQVCVHETTYIGTVSLPNRPGGYILAYQRCCRNATLANIRDPLETGATYWVAVTEAALLTRNSSPTFNQWPDVYICANRPLSFDHSATDADGDSLVYRLSLPTVGATRVNPKPQPPSFPPYSFVQWMPPYSLNDMMGGGPLTIDSRTGEIQATPNLVGQFLIGICVEEYRNGVLLSVVRRDFQFNVRICSQPPLAQFTTSESECNGLTVEFYNNSLSSNGYLWDFDYPRADPAFRSVLRDPVFTFPRSGIYDVRLRATRGSDGCFDTIIQKVAVFDNKIVPDFTYALTGCDENTDSLRLRLADLSTFDEPGYVIDDWEWTVTQNGKTVVYKGKSPETGLSYQGDVDIMLVVSSSNGCKSTLSKKLNISDIVPTLDFKFDYIGCPENGFQKIQLINLSASLNPFATISNMEWVYSNQVFTGDSIILTIPENIREVTITLKTGFYNLCNVSFPKNILLRPVPEANFEVSGADCTGLEVNFTNISKDATDFEWDFDYPAGNPAFASTEINPVFNYPDPGFYSVWLKATRSSDGCVDTFLLTIPVFENKINPDFSVLLSGCDQNIDSLVIRLQDNSTIDQAGIDIIKFQWTVTQNGQQTVYTGKGVEVGISIKGDITITLDVEANNGCTSLLSKEISVEDILPELDFNYELVGCPADGIAEIRLTNLSGPLNPYGTILNSEWTVSNQVFSGNPLILNLPQNTTQFDVLLTSDFSDNCTYSLQKSFDLSLLVPRLAYQFTPVGCPDDGKVEIQVTYNDVNSNGIALSQLNWLAGIASNLNNYSGPSINIVLPKDSLMVIGMSAIFDNGCKDILNNALVPGPFASVTFSADSLILCPDEIKSVISNFNADWTYTWSTTLGLDFSDPLNPKAIGDVNRTYVVTVTDGLCTVTDSFSVVVLKGGVQLAIVADSVTCDGNVVLNVVGGVGQGIYTWGTDRAVIQVVGTGQTLNTSFTGKEQSYYVKFVGDACSTEPASIKVTNQKPVIDNLSPYKLCRQDTTQLITLNQVPLHVNNYIWDNDPHILSGNTTSSPLVGVGPNENQPFTLYYNVVNQFGCTLRDSVLVNIGENPVMDFNFNLMACGQYEICFNALNNFDGFIRWDFGDPATNNDNSLEKSPCYKYSDSGTFNVRLTNLVKVCPFKEVIKQVTINPEIRIDDQDDKVVCLGDTITLKATSNLINVEYSWTDISGNFLASGNEYTTKINADTKVIIKGKDFNGCTDTDTIAIQVFKFQFDLEYKDSLCVDEASRITLNVNNPSDYTFEWLPKDCIVSGGSTTNPVLIAKTDKIYTVILKHITTGCEEINEFRPKVTQPFLFDLSAPKVLCLDIPTNVSLNIANPTAYDYVWSPNGIILSGANTTNPSVKVNNDVIFSVKVTNKVSGCSQDKNILLVAGDFVQVEVNAEPDFTIFEGESLDIFVVNPDSKSAYQWSTGNTGVVVTVRPLVTTTYQVTVTDENGCTAIDEVTVTVRTAKCDETDVYIPNAFTPNNDGNNDVFRVRSNFIDELELIIYNRWGQEVFRTTDLNGGWDGTFNGAELPPDSYAYYLRVLCVNAAEYRKKGNVSLLR